MIIRLTLLILIIDETFEQDNSYYEEDSQDYDQILNYKLEISRLEKELYLRERRIVDLERHIRRLKRENRVMYLDSLPETRSRVPAISYPHETGAKMSNDEMLDGVVPAVGPRSPTHQCMASCNHLKLAKGAVQPLTQYMYLMVCAEGCKKTVQCMEDNYCMPVMKENPDYFINCANKCELFKIAPKVFKSSKACKSG